MLDYDYKALDKNKQLLKGVISSNSERAAIRQLEQKDLKVVELTQRRVKEGSKSAEKPAKTQEIILSFYELATMLNSGVPIAQAVLAQQESNLLPHMQQIYSTMHSKLRGGDTFSKAIASCELDLPDYVTPMLEAGELTGELGSALSDIVEQMEYDQGVRTEMRNALTYPAILIVTGFASVLLMFSVVVPNFANVLEQGKDLHWLANLVLTVGMWTNDNLWLLLAVIGIAGFSVYHFSQNKELRSKMFSSLLKVPLLGAWLFEAEIARWSKLLGNLLKNQVALIRALELAMTGVKSLTQQNKLQHVTSRVKSGQTLSKALEDNHALTPTGYNMIRIGEKSGALPEMLLSLARLYENSGKERMKSFLIMMEPIAIIVIGAMIGLIIAGVVLAITSANDLVI